MEKPIIMVSSTFYDLKQIRSELNLFIETMGYESLLSESPSFPVNPKIGTIENCKKKVEISDILVLIIGGRYGSIDDRSGKSITNLEYIEARNKGIPIYVFIESKILHYIDLWKANKDTDFSSVVDTPLLFEFIDRIRNIDSVWTFPFEVVNNIKEILTIQLAYLFKASLNDRMKMHSKNSERIYDTLSGRSLILVIEKPRGWEHLLFFQVWIDELDFLYEKIYEYQHDIKLYQSETITIENSISWIQLRIHEISGYIDSANKLLNIRAQNAFGPPGVTGDAIEIILIARKIVKLLSAIIDWTLKIRAVKSEEPFTRVLNAMSKFPESVIINMQEFPHIALERLEKVLSVATLENTQEVILTLTFEISNMAEFDEAFSLVTNYFEE